VLAESELALLPENVRCAFAQLAASLSQFEQRAQRAELEVKHLKEVLRLERIAKYGPSSERLTDAQLELLDSEPGVKALEVQLEADLPEADKEVSVTPKKVRTARRGAESLPEHLAREEVIIPCAYADCVCPCCQGQREIIDYESSSRLHRLPPQYIVKVLKREKRACKRCEEGGVITAPLPAQIIAKGIGSNELVVDVLLAKYEMHLPLYRQEVQIERESGVSLSRQTMCGWTMECGFLLQPVCEEMRLELFKRAYVQADETPIGVRSTAVRGRNHRGFLWEYSQPYGAVIFDYQDGRGRDGPKKFLTGFEGVLQTDGYAVYNKIDGAGVIHAACMAHVRRKFKEAADVDPSEERLVKILGQIGELYAIEKQAREEGINADARRELRQQQSRPIMDQLKEAIINLRKTVLPQSSAGKSCDYALKLWEKLQCFLEHGEVEIDNNWCEQAIRPVALGRKNWLHFGSQEAGPRIAAILSVVETCHRLKIPVREYLLGVLPKLATGKRSEVASLTPQAWAAARASV
jgi:transposase